MIELKKGEIVVVEDENHDHDCATEVTAVFEVAQDYSGTKKHINVLEIEGVLIRKRAQTVYRREIGECGNWKRLAYADTSTETLEPVPSDSRLMGHTPSDSGRSMALNLPLNRKLTNYSPSFPEEQAAYERMQLVGFRIAEILMQKPRGTMAADIEGHAFWVSPLKGMADLFCTPDYEPLTADNVNVFAVSDFEGQGASDLDECRLGMEKWLEEPVFIERDAELLDAIVAQAYPEPQQG